MFAVVMDESVPSVPMSGEDVKFMSSARENHGHIFVNEVHAQRAWTDLRHSYVAGPPR